MKIFLPILISLGLLGASGALFSGCGGKGVSEDDPAALFKDAEEDIENNHYQLAIDKFRKLRNKFPYSKYAVDAQLKIADVYFKQESFGEAALAYESFRDLHPKHEKTAYAMFQIGKSHYSDMPSTVARDMTSGRKALEAFNDFLRRFPSAPESEEARKFVAEILRLLADKELYVADFYFRRGHYDSARGRYKKIMAQFPGTEQASRSEMKLSEIEKSQKK